ADARLLPGDVVLARLRVLIVLGAVEAVVPPTVAHVFGQLVPGRRDQIGPRGTPVGRLGQRAVEVEDDRFHAATASGPPAPVRRRNIAGPPACAWLRTREFYTP